MKDTGLPENVELLRTRVVIDKDRVYSVSRLLHCVTTSSSCQTVL